MEKEIDVRSLLSANLRRARKNKNLSQLELSSETGLASNFINEIEHGRKWVSANTIEKLSAALGVEPYQLFIPESHPVRDKDAAIAACCDELLDDTKEAIAKIRNRHLG